MNEGDADANTILVRRLATGAIRVEIFRWKKRAQMSRCGLRGECSDLFAGIFRDIEGERQTNMRSKGIGQRVGN